MIFVNYNPDVLSCLANLSNDEVFTPPKLVNEILDLLPNNLWSNPGIKFLDPVCKSGVFLREIAKRLNKGLEEKIPDKEARINHIMKNQLYGIALTELTALLSRRSLYCSRFANGKYSVTNNFKDEAGNIAYKNIYHTWENGKCKFCGANQEVYDRAAGLETYAYNFIHFENPLELFENKNMKFDVIIGNPPYQLNDGGGLTTNTASGSAIPLYHKFIDQAKKLSPNYLIMIIPARWYSGGRGLDEFRDKMLKDKRISYLIDYVDSRDCFPGVDIAGGICYFLWNKKHNGKCNFFSHSYGIVSKKVRNLSEFNVFIRDNTAIEIIYKIKQFEQTFMSTVVYSSNPFGFRSFFKGNLSSDKIINPIKLLTSKGFNFLSLDDVFINKDLVNTWKVVISKASSEHAGQTDKSGKKKVFSRVELLLPGEICSESYLLAGTFKSKQEAENLKSYILTKFFRYLISTILITQNIAKDKFQFVPIQDFKESWTDEKLYKKYGLTQEEIEFIESMIRPMD